MVTNNNGGPIPSYPARLRLRKQIIASAFCRSTFSLSHPLRRRSSEMAMSMSVFSAPNPAIIKPRLFSTTIATRRSRNAQSLVVVSAIPPLSTVTDSSLSVDGTTLAVLGGGSVAAFAALLSLTDPEKRRQLQAEEVGGGDKEVVKDYFNTTGFQRWKKIYGDTDDVNKVQLDIRIGHAKTVESTIKMLSDEGSLQGVTVCDAGCGTGSLSIPLAKLGAVVSASDVSASMVAEAQRKASEELANASESAETLMPKFEVNDLESVQGKFHTVICLDVLIHYPQNKADGMIAHLASLAENRLILSFAPKTFYYSLLKRIGELFPGPSKATRAYLHSEADVERALEKVGWKIQKRGLITTQFYFANLIEAVPI